MPDQRDDLASYYEVTADRDVRADLVSAVELAPEKIAIDCGCGAGADIAYLRYQGFRVYGFDIQAEAIRACRQRFGADTEVILEHQGFEEFEYPSTGLIVADASLSFCQVDAFPHVWQKITSALVSGGIFTGSFLGRRDSMLQDANKVYWNSVRSFSNEEVMRLASGFEILSFQEHEADGADHTGKSYHWHLFSVLLKKNSS